MKIKKFIFDSEDNYLNCSMLTEFVKQSGSINPGYIRVNRDDFHHFIMSIYKTGLQWLPLSEKPYVLHIPTMYGLIPILQSDNIPPGEIIIEPKLNIDDEFEKVVLQE